MYYVYILKSLKNGRYYIGSSENPDNRLIEHNQGKSKSTRPFVPYNIIYKELYQSLTKARRRESEIKKRKSRKYIEQLINKVNQIGAWPSLV